MTDRAIVVLAEDFYQGNAQASIQLGNAPPVNVTVLARMPSAGQPFAFDTDWGGGAKTIKVTFLNDAYGGTPTTDRNLYVLGASVNGVFQNPPSGAKMLGNGWTCSMNFGPAVAPVVVPPVVAPVVVAPVATPVATPVAPTLPPGRGALTYAVEAANGDWAKLQITASGSPTSWSNSIMPSNNRTLTSDECEWYADATLQTPGSPFTIDAAGRFVITATPVDPATNNGHPYKSGVITSIGCHSQQYGYFEARMLLAAPGFWPAFWFLPTSTVYTGEFDVLESGWRNDKGHVIHQTTHAKNASGGYDTPNFIPTVTPDITSGFHNYGMDWNKDRVIYYVDGVATGQTMTGPGFQEPGYAIFNLAVVSKTNTWADAPPDGASDYIAIEWFRAYAS